MNSVGGTRPRVGCCQRSSASTPVQRLVDSESARPDLDPYARSVVQHTVDGVARDISWLDSLIASERADLPVVARTEPVG